MKDRTDNGPEIEILREYHIQRTILDRVINKLREETEAKLREAISRKFIGNPFPAQGL